MQAQLDEHCPFVSDRAIITYRLEKLERKVEQDHEPRIRELETAATKVAMAATLGALFGGGVVVAVVEFLLRR